jgi:2,3-bisphosphoglycerate-dependent phosphoglycerate mutase
VKTTLLIARHGNTFSKGDVVTRVGARTDMPLSPSGLEQGRKLGFFLRDKNLLPDVVFTSALRRTRQTAEQALAAANVARTLNVEPLFNEIDYGIDENRPEADVVARVGADALKAWDEDAVVPDGWKVDVSTIIQGWIDFGSRVAGEFAGKKILVVTSNGIARFAPHLTGDFEAFRREHPLKISTGALCVFAHEAGVWRVEEWNVKP